MHISRSFAIAYFAVTISAQSAAQNATAGAIAAQIPACAIACDEAAITKIGCGLTDYACHCAHGSQLATLIPPCLANSTCTPAELQTFGAIPAKICAALNGTTSTNSTTISSTSTGIGSQSATATPSGPTKSGSSSLPTSTNLADVNSAASAWFALTGAGILGVFLPLF